MNRLVCVVAALVALAPAGASAEGVNLSGPFVCVKDCSSVPPPGALAPLAHVTQNGSDLNLVDESGDASRAWIDWSGHIWADHWNQGAIYSPDGLTIQFDRGMVWQRFVPPPPYRVRHVHAAAVTLPPK